MVDIHPDHKKNLDALKRIEGQIRGIQKMIEGRRYCVEILTQLSSVRGAMDSVQDDILERHLSGCVTEALQSGSKEDKKRKVNEVVRLLKKFKKNA
jgi:DNA-binding FrmR family transcriptional regulator